MSFTRIVFAFTLALFTVAGFANETPKVVVVGAGFAGLTTAYRLNQKGMDVHVYEARNRVGGRVFSAKIGEHIVELGGQNLTDGGEAANIHRLVDEFGLGIDEFYKKFEFSYFDNQTLIPSHLLDPQAFDPETLQGKLAEIAQSSQNMREVFDQLFKDKDLLYKSLAVRLASFEGATIEKLSSYYTNTLYYMLLGGICSVHQASDEEENRLHIASIQGGNALLLEKMAESLKEKVHLNMPLTSVLKGEDGSYELLFQNGERVNADILVLAIPCSVYNDIVFGENLIPGDRLESIRKVQYGTNAKIIIPCTEPLSDQITMMNDRIVSYFDEHCKVLTLYFTGDTGKFSHDSIFEAYRQERPMLEFGLKECCPPLVTPMIAQDASFVSYDGPIGHSWPNDPYAQGSYSYIAQGQDEILTAIEKKNGEKVKNLFAPIDGTLFFAGEHATILLDIPGTMEAACESGERTARMIQQLYE